MALFGEKYGEIVRMVEIGDGDFSRELCGGTHVRSTAEIGVVRILGETSSAANVRRIEALSGPAAIASLRGRSVALEEIASVLRTAPEQAVAAVRAREAERRELEKAMRASARPAAVDVAALAESAETIGGVPVVCAPIEVPDAKALLDVVDRVKGKLETDGAIILAGVVEERAHVVVSVGPTLVERGVRAGEIAKAAAAVLGGGGGGRDTLAQAGGSEVGRIGEALDAARAALQAILGG
jgi:alanyl-tRNA synthetase